MINKTIRCAIYTRKSSEEGLDQAYNSLDAQRDACEAYVASQVGEGWLLLPQAYDDGGFSGGTLVRPALVRLLEDIRASKVDVVVVYKVDRLTRALSDFAKIVDVLDAHGASFVSVTQAFNTTTSMGRLTLNVLLSFAQFEREVTGERIRDKIAASKKLGMWMGGNVPLGYRPSGRTLLIDDADAATVRMIFQRYLDLGSVYRLAAELDEQRVRSRSWTTLAGQPKGGAKLTPGALFHLLRNRSYLGEVPHKGAFYPGLHPALIDPSLFEQVQSKLDETAIVLKPGRPEARAHQHRGAPLVRLLHDPAGKPMSPVSARRKGGITYRYYVSRTLQTGGAAHMNGLRVPADVVEGIVIDRLCRLGLLHGTEPVTDWTTARRLIHRLDLGQDRMTLLLDADTSEKLGGVDRVGHCLQSDEVRTDGQRLSITISAALVRRGGQVRALGPSGQSAISQARVDPALSAALVRAEAWKRKLLSGQAATIDELAKAEGFAPTHASRLLRAAFLAPDLKRMIIEGCQPAALTLQTIMTKVVPLDWRDQRRIYLGQRDLSHKRIA